MNPRVSVNDLTVAFSRRGGSPSVAARPVSFEVKPGEILGLAGESGAGKSTLIRALGGMLPPDARCVGGEALLDPGQDGEIDLLRLGARSWRRLRRRRIAYFGSNSSDFWNPKLTVRQHIRETLVLAGRRKEAASRAESNWVPLLYEAGLVEPENLLSRFPGRLPSLDLWRFQIAMALMKGADLWVAEEPGTDLDAIGEDQLLRLLRELVRKRGLAMVVGSARLDLIRRLAGRVAVMGEGGIVECRGVAEILSRPGHRYTKALFDSLPDLEKRRKRLPEVGGEAVPGSV